MAPCRSGQVAGLAAWASRSGCRPDCTLCDATSDTSNRNQLMSSPFMFDASRASVKSSLPVMTMARTPGPVAARGSSARSLRYLTTCSMVPSPGCLLSSMRTSFPRPLARASSHNTSMRPPVRNAHCSRMSRRFSGGQNFQSPRARTPAAAARVQRRRRQVGTAHGQSAPSHPLSDPAMSAPYWSTSRSSEADRESASR